MKMIYFYYSVISDQPSSSIPTHDVMRHMRSCMLYAYAGSKAHFSYTLHIEICHLSIILYVFFRSFCHFSFRLCRHSRCMVWYTGGRHIWEFRPHRHIRIMNDKKIHGIEVIFSVQLYCRCVHFASIRIHSVVISTHIDEFVIQCFPF